MSRLLGIVVALFVAALLYPAALFFRSTHTELSIQPAPKVLGAVTPLELRAVNRHGFRSLSVWLEQEGGREKVVAAERPSKRWAWTADEPPVSVGFTVRAAKDGKARLTAEAVSNDLRGSVDRVSYDVEVSTRPPVVSPDGLQHYISQGGSGLVTFDVTGFFTEAGVRAGKAVSRSFQKPGGGTGRFSLFAYPWDTPDGDPPVVFARNAAGVETKAQFAARIFPKKFRKRDIEITDAFIDKVVNELDPAGTGDKLERFLHINREVRQQNNKTLSDLRLKTAEKILWNGPFVQLSNSKVESHFADVRSYVYKGKKVDEQVHLGFDLSVVKQTPVAAANDGVVLYAAPLGIYGNCIVVDHGYGLQSIYGHLSSIGVKAGEAVKKGQTMGRSGSTGMAGGDHLHFSMQVDGTQVNPVEWWDEHWIHDRVLTKLQ